MGSIMNEPICEKCGGPLIRCGKSTLTGEQIGEYLCERCNHFMYIKEGVALWKVYEQSREEEERAKGYSGVGKSDPAGRAAEPGSDQT